MDCHWFNDIDRCDAKLFIPKIRIPMMKLAMTGAPAVRCVVILVALWPSSAQAIPQAEFDTLFTQLDNSDYQLRVAAERTLTGYATTHLLTGQQVRAIQTANVNLEVSRECERIFGKFVESLQSYKDIQNEIKTQQTTPPKVNPVTGLVDSAGRFVFDDAKGSFHNVSTYDNYNLLQDHYIKIDTALRAGNVAVATAELQALRDAVAALPRGAFEFNFITPNGVRGIRYYAPQILAKIDAAQGMLIQFKIDLFNGGALDDSALPQPMPVKNAGVLPLGQSTQIALSAVVTPGSLLFLSTDDDGAPALAPQGYAFVSPVSILQSGDGLEVSGPINIDIEYGSASLLGIPSDVLRDLRIVRIANGQDFLLPTSFATPDFLTGHYTPDSLGIAADQFGEFGVVAPVPEPSTTTVILFGFGLAGGLNWLRKRTPWRVPTSLSRVTI
jgi:hypothetical protein